MDDTMKDSESFKLYKEQFFKNNRFNLIFAVIGYLSIAAANIYVAFLLQGILDAAADGTVQELADILVYAFVFLVIMLVTLLIKKVFYNRFMKKALTQYKNYVFSIILNKNINSFHKESSASYLSAFSNDLSSIENNYLGGITNMIYQLTLLIGGLAAMAYLNWMLLICVILASSFSILISVAFSDNLTKAETQVSNRNAVFLGLTKELLSGFPVIKSFKAEKEILHIFQNNNRELERIKKAKRDTGDTINILTNLSSFAVQIAIFGLGGYFAIKGFITIGVVVAFIQLVNYVVGPIQQLGPLYAGKKASEALIKKIQEAADSFEAVQGNLEMDTLQEAITFDNVSFGYEENKKNIHNVNVKFLQGKSYAIVGGSGSGKSTVLNLMSGYHSNYEGAILFDRNELKNITADSLYNLVSIIQQNVFVFDSSIAENITMFKEFPADLLESAIDKAGLKKLLQEKGKEYNCGENGSNLSGGEKQRISIARSLVRKTPVLLMDEATAALDNATSHLVEEAILSIKDLTRIIVTHKMDAHLLGLYDEIIVMNNGRIEEKGTFRELLDRKGYFYSLYNVSVAEG